MTLIEIMVVLGILTILLSIGFRLYTVVMEKVRRSRAVAEMTTIDQALTAYKADFKEYPWVEAGNEPVNLYRALIGNRRPFGGFHMTVDGLVASTDPLAMAAGKGYIGIEAMTIASMENLEAGNVESTTSVIKPSMPATRDDNQKNVLIDPWSVPYVYRYKVLAQGAKGKDWKNTSYVLFSRGPNSDTKVIPADGILNEKWKEDADSLDNVYSHE